MIAGLAHHTTAWPITATRRVPYSVGRHHQAPTPRAARRLVSSPSGTGPRVTAGATFGRRRNHNWRTVSPPSPPPPPIHPSNRPGRLHCTLSVPTSRRGNALGDPGRAPRCSSPVVSRSKKRLLQPFLLYSVARPRLRMARNQTRRGKTDVGSVVDSITRANPRTHGEDLDRRERPGGAAVEIPARALA